MKWLWSYLYRGYVWVRKNPVILLLVLIVLLANHFSSITSPSIDQAALYRGDTLWRATAAMARTLLTFRYVLVLIFGLIALGLVTMFETGANFAIFSGAQNPLRAGIAYALSLRGIQYVIYQLALLICATACILGVGYIFIFGVGLKGLSGSLFLLVIVALGYPVLYMMLSLGATIFATSTKVATKRHFFVVAFQWRNFMQLIWFYLIRLGTEAIALTAATIFAQRIGMAGVAEVALAILIVTVPLSIVRTAGFVLKLRIFAGEKWFQQFFSTYYSGSAKTSVPNDAMAS